MQQADISKDNEEDETPTTVTSEEAELSRLKTQLLLSNFTQDQLDRYEAMRRASFPKSIVRRVNNLCRNT